MNYMYHVQSTLDYIDERILETITVNELAQLAGFSTYHYYRIFNSFVGMPVMEYVTRRKLQFALHDISQGKKVLDTALRYGYETHAGFTKAFKKTFGYPPNYYRLHAPMGKPTKVDLGKLKEIKTGGIIMQPKIIKRESFKVVGYEFKTTLRNNAHSRDIPAFWDKCNIEGKEAKLYDTQTTMKHGEYGICVHTNMETDEFSYVLGVEVADFDRALDDMYTLVVPEATYAVFTTPIVSEDEFVPSIQGTWKYILEEWFPQSGYEIDDSKLDFEFYDERCHPWEFDKWCMEIHVPIKKV
ncbi:MULTISPECIES: AraC family transcriptional regulator [Bacillaceae]|uniref:Effector binding domain-containing protein n=1 Tax=Evansella alkalicola TaxID=745819 RepID=A0ABS6JQT2_9BACI|nr:MULTISPECIES: effector binding domain-containing protein [Bacillaceae]MBU9720904.1 effector binding domain-containing protein [Bacillus alkalicola]